MNYRIPTIKASLAEAAFANFTKPHKFAYRSYLRTGRGGSGKGCGCGAGEGRWARLRSAVRLRAAGQGRGLRYGIGPRGQGRTGAGKDCGVQAGQGCGAQAGEGWGVGGGARLRSGVRGEGCAGVRAARG